MTDENGRDEKLITVPGYDKKWKDATDITDVPKEILDRISHFFRVYKDLDEGKWVKVEGLRGSRRGAGRTRSGPCEVRGLIVSDPLAS